MVYLHPEDAVERGIEDGNTAKVFNDLAEVELQAKLHPSSQRGTARMYFAWERFQLDGDTNFNSLVPMHMKLTQLAQYPEDSDEHLYLLPNYRRPTGVNSDARVDVWKGGGDAE